MTIHRFFRRTAAPLILFAVVGIIAPVYAAAAAPAEEEAGWRFSFAPYIWAAALDGDITAKGTKTDVDLSFSDIFDDMDLGFLGHVEAKNGKWTLIGDLVWMKLSDDGGGAALSVDADLTQTIVELLVAYEKYEGFELLGGMRIWDFDTRIKLTGAGPGGTVLKVDNTQSWVDPVFGGRYTREIVPKLSFTVRGDVGGFSIGSSSKFTWSAVGTFGYQVCEGGTLHAGYKALDIDYEDGSGDERVKLDLQYKGPLIGMSFAF